MTLKASYKHFPKCLFEFGMYILQQQSNTYEHSNIINYIRWKESKKNNFICYNVILVFR